MAGGGGGQAAQAAGRVTSTVWELNRLRSMLAAVVVQWATCLHEGSPGSHAAPPASASALSTALASRRLAAGHSRHASLEVLPPGEALPPGETPAGETEEHAETAVFSLSPPAEGGVNQQQQPAADLSDGAGAGKLLSLQRPPFEPTSPSLGAVQLRREQSGSSLAHQFLASSSAPPPATLSELNFGAPSLMGGEEAGDASPVGSPTHGAQQQSQGQGQVQSTMPTGLVARYVALFDQRSSGSGPGSGGSSPSGLRLRSQRTQDWVRSSAEQEADAAGDVAAGAFDHQFSGQGAGERAGDGGEQATAQPPLPGPQQAQQAQRQRRPPFRLDLSNPDPELVRALTPKRRNATGGCWGFAHECSRVGV